MKSLLTLFVTLIGVTLAVPALATDPDAAKNFIDSVAAKVLEVVKDPAASKAEKQQKLETIFSDKVDINFVGKFVLGKHWREATPAQQQAYLGAYKPFLIKNYAGKLTKYSGQTYRLKPARAESDGSALITMEIVDPNGQNVYVDYRLHGSGSNFQLIDIVVEGVSLLTTQRSEFDAIVQRKGVDGLVEALTKQVAAKSV